MPLEPRITTTFSPSPAHLLLSLGEEDKETVKLLRVTYLFVCKDKENSIPQLVLCHHACQLIPCFCDSLPVIAIHYKDQTCTHKFHILFAWFCLISVFLLPSGISTLMPSYKICTWMDGYQDRYERVQTNRSYTWCQVIKCAKHFPYIQ